VAWSRHVGLARVQCLPRRQLGKDQVKTCPLGGAHVLAPLVAADRAQGYQRAELVTSEELALIKRVDRQPRAKIESILVSDGQIYALLYLRLLKKLQRVDTMQCLLVLIADALLGVLRALGLGLQRIDDANG
jgi:hypothetical protein